LGASEESLLERINELEMKLAVSCENAESAKQVLVN
jgi:hypothetical protein